MSMLLAAARMLGERVGPVVPVRGKRPTLDNWPECATRTPEDGPEWARATGVGLVTGAKAGYFALDVDGEKGAATLRKFCEKHGDLPRTWTSQTGGGGAHLFFKWPDFDVRGSAGKLGPGLDVRGTGGQVVAPPSPHSSGKNYEWAVAPWDAPLASSPVWLLEMLRPPIRVVPDPPRESDVLKRASAYLAKLPGAIDGSGGSNDAWRAALAVVRGFALCESDAYALLAAEYNPRCTPPWSEKELQHKVKDASQSANVPWGYLRDKERPSSIPPPPPPRPKAPPTREVCADDNDDPAGTRLNMQPIGVLLREEIPATKWLVAPWMEEDGIGAIVAPPNLGKTLLAFWFATQVAAAGHRVGIIEEEGGRRGFQKRIDRAALACGGQDKCKSIHYAFKPRIHLMRPQDVEAMCVELVGYKLIIIDSLSRVITGVEENDASAMGRIVEGLDNLRDRTGAAVWTVHHTGKSKWKPGEVPRLEDGRGSSALQAGLDTVLGLAPVADREPGFVKFELHITKQRDEDNQVPPRVVRIAMTGPAATVELEVKGGENHPATYSESRLYADILARIPQPNHGEYQSKKTLARLLKKNETAVARLVDQMINGGVVKVVGQYALVKTSAGSAGGGLADTSAGPPPL